MNPDAFPSLSNAKIGFLHVLDRAETNSQGRAMYWCRCERCGTERLIRAQNLRRGLQGRWQPKCKGCEK